MQSFKYQAMSRDGARVNGVIEAVDEFAAVNRIKAEYPILLKIESMSKSKANSILNMEIGAKLNEKELSVMCSQFSIILRAGVPIDTCIKMIADQTRDKTLKGMLEKAASDVSQGTPLAEAFEKNCKLLPVTFIETIKAGEMTGSLEDSFDTLQKYYAKSHALSQKLKQAMSYPIFVVCVAIIVLLVVMIKVMPTMSAVFADLGGDLPPMTRVMIGMSDWSAKYWWVLVGILLFLILFFYSWTHSTKGALEWNRIMLKLPVLGNIAELNASAEFANTMSALLHAGLPVADSLAVTSKTLSNGYLGRSVRRMVDKIEEGFRLGDIMRGDTEFPQVLTEMTAIGEETGELEHTLEVIGDYYSSEADYATQRAIDKLEPTMMILLAIFAGFIVIGIYLPMFTMYNLM